MKKRTLALTLVLALLAGLLSLGASAMLTSPTIRELIYYDKNPDPSVEGEQADYPAVWMTFENGSDNLEVFALQAVGSEAEARSPDFGMDGFQVEGVWHRVIGLWTVEPSRIIDKDNGLKALTVPLYFVAGKPPAGSRLFLSLYDYELPEAPLQLVEVVTPEEGATAEVTVAAEESSQPEEAPSEESSAEPESSRESEGEVSILIAPAEESASEESSAAPAASESSAAPQPEAQSGSPLPWILLGVGAVAVLGGAAFALTRKKKT